MAGFNFEVKYRKTQLHANEYYLSPSPGTTKGYDNVKVFQINQFDNLSVTRTDIKNIILKDPVLRSITFDQTNKIDRDAF